MSSESASGPSAGHCLFCSLGCPLQLERFAPQRWRPAYDSDTRLCARGQMVADLLHQPSRVYRPTPVAGRHGLGPAVHMLAERLAAEDARLSIWLDGNVALEDLAAARSFCESRPDLFRLRVHLPPHEMGVVAGLDAAGAAQTAATAWADADAFVVVGNPLATHPPVARHLLRWGADRSRTPLIAVDSSAAGAFLLNYTPHHFICRPGYEYWVVAALLQAAGFEGSAPAGGGEVDLEEIFANSGVEAGRISQAGELLRAARRPAVIIAPQAGGLERWRALTYVAATWAQQRGGTVSILTEYANALGVARYMKRYGIADWVSAGASGDAEDAHLLLVVGWDPSSAYPRPMWEPAVQCAAHVALASAFDPAATDWVDEVLPLALASEAGGTYVLADGAAQELQPLISPPSGVPTVRELFALLGDALASVGAGSVGTAPVVSTADVAVVPSSTPLPPTPPAPEAPTGLPAVLVADPTQYFDGQITRHALWTQQAEAVPELWIAPGDAQVLGLSTGQFARIRNEQGAARVRVVVAYEQPEFGGCGGDVQPASRVTGWLAVGRSAAAVRQLGAWSFGAGDEGGQAGVIHVQVERDERAGVRQEAVHADG